MEILSAAALAFACVFMGTIPLMDDYMDHRITVAATGILTVIFAVMI